MNDYPIMM